MTTRFGDTPLSWSGPPSTDDATGVSSFLAGLAAIILVVAGSVKRGRKGDRLTRRRCSINAASTVQTPRGGSGMIILFGRDRPYSDQTLWHTLAYNNWYAFPELKLLRGEQILLYVRPLRQALPDRTEVRFGCVGRGEHQ